MSYNRYVAELSKAVTLMSLLFSCVKFQIGSGGHARDYTSIGMIDIVLHSQRVKYRGFLHK